MKVYEKFQIFYFPEKFVDYLRYNPKWLEKKTYDHYKFVLKDINEYVMIGCAIF